MLLSNLTASSAACSIVLNMKLPVIPDDRLSNSIYPVDSRCGSCPAPVPYPSGETKEVLALPLLIDAFVEGAQVVQTEDLSKRTRKAELHFLASVFANFTVVGLLFSFMKSSLGIFRFYYLLKNASSFKQSANLS